MNSPQALSITNQGGEAAAAIGFAFSGTEFNVTGTTCVGPLAWNSSCSVSVEFCPALPTGQKTETMGITYTDSTGINTVSVTVSGQAQ